MSESQTKGSQRAAKRKAHYKAQFARTEANAKRRLRRHLRSNPGDAGAAKRYEFMYGTPEAVGLSSKGTKLAARAIVAELKKDAGR